MFDAKASHTTVHRRAPQITSAIATRQLIEGRDTYAKNRDGSKLRPRPGDGATTTATNTQIEHESGKGDSR